MMTLLTVSPSRRNSTMRQVTSAATFKQAITMATARADHLNKVISAVMEGVAGNPRLNPTSVLMPSGHRLTYYLTRLATSRSRGRTVATVS